MLPLIRSEVSAHNWISSDDIINFIAVSESTPGPFAINIATFIGFTTAGIPGAVCATAGVVIPSFVIILIVAGFYEKFNKSRIVKGAMTGLRPAVIGLIAAALVSLGIEVFFPAEGGSLSHTLISVAVFAVMSFLAFKKKNPILIIVLSAVAGIITGCIPGL